MLPDEPPGKLLLLLLLLLEPEFDPLPPAADVVDPIPRPFNPPPVLFLLNIIIPDAADVDPPPVLSIFTAEEPEADP